MTPDIECPSGAQDTGAYRLEWSGPEGAQYRLEEREPSGDVETLYAGEHVASTVSGRTEGTYGYRVGIDRAGDIAWSSWCEVRVEPPALATALGFFGFGVFVVVATVALVVRGHRAHRRGELS